MTEVLAVAFALRGTLVDDGGLVRAAVEKLAAEALAHDPSQRHRRSPEAVAERILASGSASAADIATSLAELVATPPRENTVRAFSARYRQISASLVPDCLAPRRGAIETIRELSRLAIPTAILTNAIGSVAARAATSLGFTGRLFAADDTGFAKPAADAYAALVGSLGLPAHTVYYVSADPFDVAAASAVGLTTVYLDDAARAVSGGAQAPAHAIASLPALLPFLAEPYTRGALALRRVFHTALAFRPGHIVPAEFGRRPDDTDD